MTSQPSMGAIVAALQNDDSLCTGIDPSRLATLIERLPEEERSLFADFVTLKRQELSDPVTGLQPLAMEGTTFASSCMYTHNANDRHNRKAWYAMDKKVAVEAQVLGSNAPFQFRYHPIL